MPNKQQIDGWLSYIHKRYVEYLTTSFSFSEPQLRESFRAELEKPLELMNDPVFEPKRSFAKGVTVRRLGEEYFSEKGVMLTDALFEHPLYEHQERAVRSVFEKGMNIVVATGTASGKTECFLYPILFDLFQQHLSGELEEKGVRAMILYPMNALANDQRKRLGKIYSDLERANSPFRFSFGQYTGQTPEDISKVKGGAEKVRKHRLPGEVYFREEMRINPPHILLTNYSMLEYLLIRPDDVALFDNEAGKNWKYIVLDEAHQYRGTKGMEMAMLIRRLKQRVECGGRKNGFNCIATSATLASGSDADVNRAVAQFASELFDEPVDENGVIFSRPGETNSSDEAGRFHVFFRALEGAFLLHENGQDRIVLKRATSKSNGKLAKPLEIALCKACGQHYFVGVESGGFLKEACRDLSSAEFKVEFYLPLESGDCGLCKICGKLKNSIGEECCGEEMATVLKCDAHTEHPDRLRECAICEYGAGTSVDPVQEIVYGTDGPNAVISTALHRVMPKERRKVLAFADSRQDAAFFAWYAEKTYGRFRDRNYILRILRSNNITSEGYSIDDLASELQKVWEEVGYIKRFETDYTKRRKVLTAILREAVSDEGRITLGGVGLVKWFVQLPTSLDLTFLQGNPWHFSSDEARQVVGFIMNWMRLRRAIALPSGRDYPPWSKDISDWGPKRFSLGKPQKDKTVQQWTSPRSLVVNHLLRRILMENFGEDAISAQDADEHGINLMTELAKVLRKAHLEPVIEYVGDEYFQLNSDFIRIRIPGEGEIWECEKCATVSHQNIRGICPRNKCTGTLTMANLNRLSGNHYRKLYEDDRLPFEYKSEEHTAQIETELANERQEAFCKGDIHLLSSSTTYEIGVDLGDLDVVFLRNVPPETFNYIQRSGRSGREKETGLVITYCRRNPHDLYHYRDPENSIINAKIDPPILSVKNEKIIGRHVMAVALSEYFRKHPGKFENVGAFVENWTNPTISNDLRHFCMNDADLVDNLKRIVPESMQEVIGLNDCEWIERIVGMESRLGNAEAEVCDDYAVLEKLVKEKQEDKQFQEAGDIYKRQKTIENEDVLSFLSRKAIIPKYGFPVDVVELHVQSLRMHRSYSLKKKVSLQRDLSQAIAEYAPGGSVVANKIEWKSYGVKTVSERAWKIRSYRYDNDARTFEWIENEPLNKTSGVSKYLIPRFGFVTDSSEQPTEPQRRVQRLYTTRPFFPGFRKSESTTSKYGIQVTKAVPGTLVILCEGKRNRGFYICRECGTHESKRTKQHNDSMGNSCSCTLELFSLGHELETDIICMEFPDLNDQWSAYSVAYAILLGATEAMKIPSTDLNVTISRSQLCSESSAVVLYDDVPGGAGLVSQLEKDEVLLQVLRSAKYRVSGVCGCNQSCYGCLRSYRNQFAHAELDRERAFRVLESLLPMDAPMPP